MIIFLLTVFLSAVMAMGLVAGIHYLSEYRIIAFKKYLAYSAFGFTVMFYIPFMFVVKGIEKGFF